MLCQLGSDVLTLMHTCLSHLHRYTMMLQCWQEQPENRPGFNDLHTRLQAMVDDTQVSIDSCCRGCCLIVVLVVDYDDDYVCDGGGDSDDDDDVVVVVVIGEYVVDDDNDDEGVVAAAVIVIGVDDDFKFNAYSDAVECVCCCYSC